MDDLAKFIWAVIGIAVLVHGYFYVKYGSPDPCVAAVGRLKEDGSQAWLAYGVKTGMGNRDFIQCYAVAFMGEQGLKTTAQNKPAQ